MVHSAPSRRDVHVLLAAAGLLLAPAPARATGTLRFAVGPFQPTPGDTRRAFEPFFRHVAAELGLGYELVVTTDWAGIATALANGQVDVAWMGPWGYVLARQEGGAEAVATVKYDGKPTYHAIIVGKPGLPIRNWPADAKGMSISFADVGSTSGWLVPSRWFQQQGIDPKTFFRYRDGASHPANEIAVASGQVDLATDFDRNRDSMIDRGLIRADQSTVYWTSEPLPNDPLVVRRGLDPRIAARLREIVVAIDDEAARTLMPPRYTGWVVADHETYRPIEEAGIALGRIRPRPASR